MGSVHLARDLRLGRLVAIKFLTSDNAATHERLLAEARATARCQHPNIVIIHDVGIHDVGIHDVGSRDSRPYMVLEYLQGQTLREWLEERRDRARRGPDDELAVDAMTGHRVVEIMVPIVRALAYAHDNGIVHRDLKPANIMMTAQGTIKVLDFGIARLRADAAGPGRDARLPASPATITETRLVGTLPYMAPEQMECTGIDQQCDIWAVGIMLFEMVMGRHPLPSFSPADLLSVTDLDEPMPRVSELRPSLGPLAGVIDRCLLKDKEHRTGSARELLSELEALLPERSRTRNLDDRPPFAGLAAFQERDAHRFFGRSREIAEVTSRLVSEPLVAIAGPSGLGKSSLVRAGVIPALKGSGDGWSVHIIRPGRRPLHALAETLHNMTQTGRGTGRGTDVMRESLGADTDDGADASVRARLAREPGYLGACLRSWARRKRRRLLLFVDQFEELFTLGTDPAEVRAFVACLDGVADDASSPLRAILSVRSDFLACLAEHRGFMARVSRGLFFLSPLDRDGLREALERPIADAGYRFEHADLVAELIDQVADAPGALPLMQFAASRLWSERDRQRQLLTDDSFRSLGGLAGALAAHADTVVTGMAEHQRRLARRVFERLVTPERTRAIVSMDELRELATSHDARAITDLVQHLVGARLLVIDDRADGCQQVEVVHESLIASWPQLTRWLDENRDDALFLARLRTAARDWQQSGRSEGLLWRGEPAKEARRWRNHYRGELARREQGFLDAVFTLHDRARRHKRNLLYGSITVLAVLVVITALALSRAQKELVTVRAQEALLERQRDRLQATQSELEQQRDGLQAKQAELQAKQRELKRSLQAEKAAHEATGEARAESARRAQEARQAEREARRAEARARREERRARESEKAAKLARDQAEEAAERERKSRADLDHLRRSAVGHIDPELN